jgi:hypothetical protein
MMGWSLDYNGRELGPDLDRWITGNWGDDAVSDDECEPLTLEDRADVAYERSKEDDD